MTPRAALPVAPTGLPPLDPTDAPPRPAAVPFARSLASHGERVALIDPAGATLTYRDLSERVAATSERLGAERRLVLIAAANEVEPIVTYLAALAGGHPVLLVPAGNHHTMANLVSTYDPDVVVGRGTDVWAWDERRPGTAHELHPDLALLLCTSGSTGAAKVVRLSHDNVQSNAAAIARYLHIDHHDRAATTLPMAYCYGLSVINSHLHRGAGLVLTSQSVVDPCFWEAFRATAPPASPACPTPSISLDRIGFADFELPDLRYVTQAGGRLAPARVREFAELGQRRGWDLFVMYGQSEATARMAYLSPDDALARPTAIGNPIPGGAFSIERPDAEGVGELVYRGPNVMLGYAEQAGDLARGRTITELRTGDLARQAPDGLYEIVGRTSRLIKVFGLRVDLDQVERVLGNVGLRIACTGRDGTLIVAVEPAVDPHDVIDLVTSRFDLPARCVVIEQVESIPRLHSGKPDYQAILALSAEPPPASTADDTNEAHDLREVFARVLGVEEVTDDATFVTLGGDSLSYVEVSMKIEDALGYVPAAWHVTPIGQLRALAPRRSTLHAVETGVVLRAVAIVLVVGSHMGMFGLWGGAHVLLAVAGFNFARFRLAASNATDHLRAALGSVGRIAVPSVLYLGALYLLSDRYTPANVLLVNNYLADGTWRYWYWFIEALVHILVVITLVFCIPAVRRLEHRHPFGLAFGTLVATLALRQISMGDPANQIYRSHAVVWLFVLGWAAQRARTGWQRLAVSVVVVAAVPGFFDTTPRDALVVAGLLAVIWVPQLRVPSLVKPIIGAVAGASLYIYLTHWQVYPPLLEHTPPVVALMLTVAVGIAVSLAVQRVVALRSPGRHRSGH